ncbi:MAG: NAD(+)/NADH kinase [candidate division Zixibacteria bacterium]|nr:NAD(+)/NADH kinase [candidate division Zixibacteria bacterium]
MVRKRHIKSKNAHYCILVNKAAAGYQSKQVKTLINAIRKSGGYYTIYEPVSAMDLYNQAMVVVGRRRPNHYLPLPDQRRGPITALVAAGGDGTFNLIARAAVKAGIPMGALPLGRFNNISRFLCAGGDFSAAVRKIVDGNYRQIDTATVANQIFIGSIGLGFIPELAELLEEKKTPRFGLGWSQLGARAAARVKPVSTVIKMDAFRFEVKPLILNINLMSFSVGLPLTPSSLSDDGRAEIIFDQGNMVGEFSTYTRLIFKRKYMYGNEIRLYRGQDINIQSTQGRKLYLDGELIEMPGNSLEIKINRNELKVFC